MVVLKGWKLVSFPFITTRLGSATQRDFQELSEITSMLASPETVVVVEDGPVVVVDESVVVVVVDGPVVVVLDGPEVVVVVTQLSLSSSHMVSPEQGFVPATQASPAQLSTPVQ